MRSQRAYRFDRPGGDGSNGRFLWCGYNAVVAGAERKLIMCTLRGAGAGFCAVDDNLMKLELKLSSWFSRLQLQTASCCGLTANSQS